MTEKQKKNAPTDLYMTTPIGESLYKQEERLGLHSLISKIGDFIIREESETLFFPAGISLPTRLVCKVKN